MERVLASRDPVSLGADEHLVNRYGVRIPVDGGISAVIDNLGRLVGATITLRDVTDTRNATEEPEGCGGAAARVVDTAVDGVMFLDAEGRILMFNAACPLLFGYTAIEMAGCAVAHTHARHADRRARSGSGLQSVRDSHAGDDQSATQRAGGARTARPFQPSSRSARRRELANPCSSA